MINFKFLKEKQQEAIVNLLRCEMTNNLIILVNDIKILTICKDNGEITRNLLNQADALELEKLGFILIKRDKEGRFYVIRENGYER